MKNVKFLFSLYLILLPFILYAKTGRENAVYVEVLGAGGWYSLNYERKLLQANLLALHLRSGVSSYRLKDYELKWNPGFQIPVTAIATYGRKHQLELSAGQTLSSLVYYKTEQDRKARSFSLSTHAGIGYRYSGKKGLLLRVTYIPMLEYQKDGRHWLGFSIGYAF